MVKMNQDKKRYIFLISLNNIDRAVSGGQVQRRKVKVRISNDKVKSYHIKAGH